MESKTEDAALAYLLGLPRNMVKNAMRIRRHGAEAVHRIDADHWDVLSLNTPSRRVRVYRNGDEIRCASDRHDDKGRHYNQDKPCAHILVVLISEGIVELPDTAGAVWTKGKEGRDQAAEARAWALVPVRAPQILAKLLMQGLAVIDPPPPPPKPGETSPVKTGRPRKPLHPLVYQSVMRTLTRWNLNAAKGAMLGQDHLLNNPHGPCGIATVSRFLSGKSGVKDEEGREKPPRVDPDEVLEKLLALSTWPVRPYEAVFHPDGTGLTEQRFSAYFDERYAKDRAKQKAKKKAKRKKAFDPFPLVEGPADEVSIAVVEAARDAAAEAVAGEVQKHAATKARVHHWTYTEILWSYRYTMIAALYSQQGPFGEAPWLLPLLDRARLMLDVAEVGGDKAYSNYYVFAYAAQHGIDAQVKFKDNANPTRSFKRKKAYKRAYERSLIDPEGYAAKANRRNNAETGNHAAKAILGDQLYSKDARAQRNEILCMALAYNLTRLVYLEVERGLEVDFEEGARRLAAAKWESLQQLHAKYRVDGKPRAEWSA